MYDVNNSIFMLQISRYVHYNVNNGFKREKLNGQKLLQKKFRSAERNYNQLL